MGLQEAHGDEPAWTKLSGSTGKGQGRTTGGELQDGNNRPSREVMLKYG